MTFSKNFRGIPWFTAGDRIPPWCDRRWPFSGPAEQQFEPLDPSEADAILLSEQPFKLLDPSKTDAALLDKQQFEQIDPFTAVSKPRVPSIQVNLATVRASVNFAGFAKKSAFWSACFRQQVLVNYKNDWILLFAPAQEPAVRRVMPEIEHTFDLSNVANSMYLNLNRQNANVYIETLKLSLERPSCQDLDEIENIAKDHSELTQMHLNLGELLITWGVPNSRLWPELKNDFKDCEALEPYLVDRRILHPSGMHPLHAPADTALIVLAKKWLELRSDQGGPAGDKQRKFVTALTKDVLGVRPSELLSVMKGWRSNVQTCANSTAGRLNKRLEEYQQEWRVDAANGGRCRIIDASSLKAKNNKRKLGKRANSTNKTRARKV